MHLQDALDRGKKIRVIGFDDAHHQGKPRGAAVNVAGVICSGTRFEGMIWGELSKDGMESTEVLGEMLTASKFANQLHLVLLDGITFGGCNVVDLPKLSVRTGLPCVSVMRRAPNIDRFRQVVESLPEKEERWRRVQAAGPIHEHGDFFFQVSGASEETIGRALVRLTDQGKVPEALRVAHLIGSAVMLGQSGKRA